MAKSIFIQIAAYRDAETSPTILDLYAKSSGKYRINVGVVWQLAPGDSHVWQELAGLRLRNVFVNSKESQGCCWARSLGYRMYRDEDYVLSLDSHMRFAENWDDDCVTILESLPRKSVISVFPAAYEPPDKILPSCPHTIEPGHFDASGLLIPLAVPCDPVIMEHHLISAGFIFSRGYLFKQVPYDPQIYFLGEESTLGARFWTHGWNIYSPGKVLAYHYYTREREVKHWTDHNIQARANASTQRVHHVLSGACFDSHGLGSVRDFAEYCRVSRINHYERKIEERK